MLDVRQRTIQVINTTKLYKHIEDNMQEYIDMYKEEVIEVISDDNEE